jgi:hypothetical protein
MADEVTQWNEYAHQPDIGGKLRDHGGHLALFQQFPIRRTWVNGEWWYSVVDVMGALSGSTNPRNYWFMMKKRMLAEEGIDTSTVGVRILKLPDTTGRMRDTDCANTEALLRLIQSVRSPNAEPFKVWLARVDAMVMDLGEVTDLAVEAGGYIREALTKAGSPMPEDMPQYPPLPPGEWMPATHPSRINWNADADADADDQGPPILLIERPKSE